MSVDDNWGEALRKSADRVNANSGAEYMLKTSPRWFLLEIQRGNVAGHAIEHVFSHNPSAGTTAVDIWKGTGNLTFLQVPVTIEAISTSADDDAVGIGTRVITVHGLDENWNVIQEDITMNGITATLPTTKSFIRVRKAEVKDTGTYGVSNSGIITIRVSGAGSTLGEIGTDNGLQLGSTFNSHYSVPAGKTAYILEYEVITAANKIGSVHFIKRERADVTTAPFGPVITKSIEDGLAGPNGHSPVSPEDGIPEKSDVWFKGLFVSGTGEITVNYEMLLIDN